MLISKEMILFAQITVISMLKAASKYRTAFYGCSRTRATFYRTIYSTTENNDDSKSSIPVPTITEPNSMSTESLDISRTLMADSTEVLRKTQEQESDIVHSAQALKAQEDIERSKLQNIPTPKTLKNHLDDYIIGQSTTKKIISVALYKHQFIQQLSDIDKRFNSVENGSAVEPELEKSNILLLGPSGSGKTLIAKTLAKLLKVPISITDCTSLTQAGFVGEDCESCIEKLLINSGYDVEACERGIVVLDEIDKLSKPAVYSGTKDIAGEGVQQGLLKLIEGSKVAVKVKNYANVKGAGDYANADQRNGPTEQNFIIDTSNILFIAMGAFIGLDKIIAQRFKAASTIGFDDSQPDATKEEDSDNEAANLSATNVDDDGLHFQEKIRRLSDDELKTSNVAQVKLASGSQVSALQLVAPIDLQQFGLIPELIGRLPILTALDPLSINNLVQISTEPKNSIIKQYEYFFRKIGVRLAITKEAIQKIAKISILNGTGARGLRSILEKILLTVNYDCPGSGVSFVLIDQQVINRFQENDGLINGETADNSIEQSAKYFSRGEIFKFLNEVVKEDVELAQQIEEEYNIPKTAQKKGSATG